MKFVVLLVLLTVGTAYANTHVNISFSQQHHSKNAANLDETRNDHARLEQPSESFEQYQSSSNYYRGDQNDRLARIQADDKKTNVNIDKNREVAVADSNQNHEPAASDYRSRSERVQNSGGSGQFIQQSHDQHRGFYNSNNGDHQQYDQLRKMSALDKQNMEFERYIQNYHSGPTVETVYESAKSGSQQTLVPSSANEGSQRVVAINQRMSKVQKFERLVSLPSTADNMQSSVDASKQAQNVVVNLQPVQASESSASTSSLVPASSSSSSSVSSSSSSVPSVSASSANGNNFKISLNQRPVSVGKDGINFDLSTSYNKPNYNDASFKYNNDGNFHNQYPPSVNEPQSGYGDYYQPAYSNNNNNDNHYYSNFHDRQQVEAGYLPAEHNQRPIVTKTIQIAQPAIKAKKYEVRHPAIQKEFYDIEERVIIKPAGTVVVELERPVAKILKGETTLPLGHPHPAVASAYMNNGNSPAFSNIVYSSAGGSATNQANHQYNSNYNTKTIPEHHQSTISGSTIASSVTATSTHDQSAKERVVESNLNKQYKGENHFVAASSANEPKSQNREIVVLTDSHGNQRQVSTDQFTYSRDETDKVPPRPLYNHRNPFVYNENNHHHASQRSGFQESNHNNGQSNAAPQRSGFQANLSDRDGFNFEAEYINKDNLQKDSKPARLQDASARVTEQQPIIKHEHKIVLSPSQHNIYLARNIDVPQTKFVEEAAHVREIKPYLQNRQGSVIVYASNKQKTDLPYTQRSEYQPQARVASQVVQYREPTSRVSQTKTIDKRLEYSAPYAQMRYHTGEEQYNVNYQRQQQQQQLDISNFDRNDRRKSEKLVLEDKPTTEKMMMSKKSDDNMMEKQAASQAHFKIEIPHHMSEKANKGIVVSSKIRPMMTDSGKDQTHNSKLEISVTSNGEPMGKQQQQSTNKSYEKDNNNAQNNNMQYNDNDSESINDDDDREHLSNLKTKPDCDQSSPSSKSEVAADYKSEPAQHSNYKQQKFMRIVEATNAASSSASDDGQSVVEPAAVSNIQTHNVDVNAKNTNGHAITPGSRVIAATPPLKESSPSESFHKRRIVVNHPFQTVREVVEHEPYTNYHEVQVNEPASPALYQSANYFQSHGALRQAEHAQTNSPGYYH